ncbi:MAG: hypothetical protein FH762_18755, partial [Firmicutes bacterium]|nr:hypothetical protein [Bacillota bacterium]
MAANEKQVVEINQNNEVLPPDIQERIGEAKRQNEALMALMKELLKDGTDYGTVPGVPKPFLQQPGAQQLGLVFKFRPEFEKIDSIIDFEQEPVFISYEYKCKIYHRENGIFMGEGVGACNSYEKKYKYYKEGIVFEDPLDRQNTLVKMAKKRAYVDAMLNVTGASRLFTQDPDGLDDIDETYTNGNSEPGEKKMPFGKNKGKKLKDIDDGYLKWVAEKADKDWLKEAAQAVLDQRNGSNNGRDNSKSNNEGKRELSGREKEIADLVNGDKGYRKIVIDFLEYQFPEVKNT